MTNHFKRVLQATVFGAGLASAAAHANAAEYLIASLIGDRITVTSAGSQTGTRIDSNNYRVVPLPQLPFDDAIEASVVRAVTVKDPAATFKGLQFRSGLPNTEMDREPADEVARKLTKALAPQIDPAKKQWIVALIPLRVDLRMPLPNSYAGQGKSGGVGYYIDRSTRVDTLDASEIDRGFLGAFSNFVLALIDPATGNIVARKSVQNGAIKPVVGSGQAHPWDVISAEQKVEMINQLLVRELNGALPEVLASLK
jgi:hypothetical protein